MPDERGESMKHLHARLERERAERERARLVFARAQLPLWRRVVLALRDLYTDYRERASEDC